MRIKLRMKELNLTQEAVANRADISQGMVYKLVSGKSEGTSKLVELANALECSVEWLATGVDVHRRTIMEESDIYTITMPATKQEVKQLMQTLPLKEQKSLTLEMVNDLLSDD